MNSFMQSAWRIGTENLQMQQGAFQGWLGLFNRLMEQQNQLLAYQFEVASKVLHGAMGDGNAEPDPVVADASGSSPGSVGRKAEVFSPPPVLMNPTKETVYQWLEDLREQQPTDCG